MENNNYLAHHGVKGQKWGERKYQNMDGSLTPEGRRHYGYGDGDRQKLRSEIKILREKARAERKMARVQNAERIKYEKQRQKLDIKMDKVKNADKNKADRLREKQQIKSDREQRRQLANFKARHPLQYQKLKKYLKSDGTLNDEGRTLFFGNGKRKTETNMSNQDLRDAANRIMLKNKYNEQKANYDAHDSKAQAIGTAKKVLGTGLAAFIGSLALTSAADALSDGPDSVDLRSNGKKAAVVAMGTMGTVLTKSLGLTSNKGNKAYNAFEIKSDFFEKAKKSKTSAKTETAPYSSRTYTTTPTSSTKKSSRKSYGGSRSRTSESGEAVRFNTTPEYESVGRMRRTAHHGSQFVNTFNSVYGSRRASTAESSDNTSRALSVIENIPTSSIPYSEIY